MPASTQFQLFPPPPPRTRGKKSSFRKEQRKNSASSGGTSPKNEDKGVNPSEKSDAVIVQIIEDTNVLAPTPAKTKPQSPETEVRPRSNNSVSPLDKELPPPPPLHPVKPNDPPTASGSHGDSLPGPPKSPVAFKSMFPVYNHALPLSKQNYYPQRVSVYNASSEAISGDQCSHIPSRPSNIDHAPERAKNFTSGTVNFPADVPDPAETEYSSRKELEQLWEAADGQGQIMSLRLLNLKLSKIQPGTFVFGSRSKPFYTLQIKRHDRQFSVQATSLRS